MGTRTGRPSFDDGFTLVELLIVIVVLGILIAIAVPTFLNQQDKAKDASALASLRTAYVNAKSDQPDHQGNFSDASTISTELTSNEPELGSVTTIDDPTKISAQGQLYIVTTGTPGGNGNFQAAILSKSGHLCTVTVVSNKQPSYDCSTSTPQPPPPTKTWTWTQLTPTTTMPALTGASMSYDSGAQKLVLFGGRGSSYSNATYTWDGTNWTKQNPATNPTAAANGAMAYDTRTAQTVLFGGAATGYLGATWTWDGANWTKQSPASSPAPRYYDMMADDPSSGQTILFGGYSQTTDSDGNPVDNYYSDTWNWTGTNWVNLSPATSPPGRDDAAMAYDPAHGQIVLFGGDGPGLLRDTWTWDGTTWTKQTPATSPPAREGAQMAFDPDSGQLILFGGYAGGRLNDTWAWNGSNWSQLTPSNSPSARNDAAMAFDGASKQLILFGGTASSKSNDTWVYDQR